MKKVYCSLFFFGTLSSVSAQWTMPTAMYETRAQHVAVTLNSGKVLAAGGWDNTIHLTSAEVYDPLSDSWAPTANYMASAHTTGTAVKLTNGKVLVTGGYDGLANVPNCDVYDPASDMWSATEPLLVGRSYHTATLLNDGRVLVAGGYNGVTNMSECELYDPVTGTWSPADSMITGRSYHTATLLNDGKVLVAGGYHPAAGYQLASAELYDPVTNTWTSISNMNDARAWHAASVLADGKIMVSGGEHFTGEAPYAYEGLQTAEVYDPVAGSWTYTADMPGGLCYNQQHSLTGKVLVIAGQAHTDYGSGFASSPGVSYLYDISANTWTPVPMNIDGRLGFASVRLSDGRVMVTGGEDNSAEIFDQFLSAGEEKNQPIALQVYPNPARERLNISVNGNERLQAVKIYDVSGKAVWAQTGINALCVQVDLSDCRPGIYTVHVQTPKGSAVQKVILNK